MTHWGENLACCLVPLPQQPTFSVGEDVYVHLRSDKETGLAVLEQLGCPEFDGRHRVRFYSNNSTYHINPKRMHKIVVWPRSAPHPQPGPMVLVCAETSEFRRLAHSQLNKDDRVVDVGSSYGVGTAVMALHCGVAVGVDISEECVVSARKAYPHIQFLNFDVIQYPHRLKEIILGQHTNTTDKPFNKVFVDVGGNRDADVVAHILPLVLSIPSVQLVVVKSKHVHRAGVEHQKTQPTNVVDDAWGVPLLSHASDWLKALASAPSTNRHLANKRGKQYHFVGMETNDSNHTESLDTHEPAKLETEGELATNNDASVLFSRFPLRYPPKNNPDGKPICRYHNYGVCVAHQHGKQCQFDHDHCHYCGKLGHIAKNCPDAR